ncbi:hypothetical protein D3C72_2310970 [compost metagenome]
MVQVIGAPRDWRAQVIGGNIPMFDTIKMLQQRTVEHFNRRRIGKIYRNIAPGIRLDERLQPRATGDQRREIIA